MDEWALTDASVWRLAGEETQGLQPHPWLAHPDRARTWLFKRRAPGQAGPLFEDIVEKLAAELGGRLGIPCARVELAHRHGVRGCLVEDLRPSGWEDQAGQVVLQGFDQAKGVVNPRHTLGNIHMALAGFEAPPGFPEEQALDAFDVFAGYLVFDALIANGDRHDRNWTVLRRPPGVAGREALCGSYDHASSLGFNVSDEDRARRLVKDTVQQWARAGKARQFQRVPGAPRQTLVDLAADGLQRSSSRARSHWMTAVEGLRVQDIDDVLAGAPALSATARTFTRQVLLINRERLLRLG